MLEDLKPLEVVIDKLKKKLLDPELINEKKIKKKLSFLLKKLMRLKKLPLEEMKLAMLIKIQLSLTI